MAASVTAALFNTAGEKMTKKDIKDLPVFGDAVDTASSVAGHLHGLWLALVQMALALQRAGHDLERDLPPLAKALREAAAWEFHVPVYVLEGTGGIEPMVLPTGEWSANDPQMMAQMKATRTLYETAAKVAPTLVANARFRGLGFYDAPQEPDRRLSTFYRGVSMLMSRKLMAMNPLYGVVAFINCKTQTRGLDIGAVLRDMGKPDGGPQAVGLVSAFASDPTIGRAVWDAEVEPLIACLMNQMPLSVYGRFLPAQTARPARTRAPTALESALPERATAAEALARIGHPLTLRTLLAMEQCPPAELGLALDRHSAGLALALKSKPLAHRHTLRGADPTIVPVTKTPLVDARTAVLTTQPWQLQQPGVAQKMIAELEALKKRGLITSYVLARNRPLSQCLDTVDIILRLPEA